MTDYPFFEKSRTKFENLGWKYKLWSEPEIEKLVRTEYPKLWPTYKTLLPIQRVDLAKYCLADRYGGIVSDLDVLPKRPLEDIVGEVPYLFDRCSRKNIAANDFFYTGTGGLPGFVKFFVENIRRVNSIPVYRQWRLRYVFQSTGPDAFTRYLKQAHLFEHVRAISNRHFLDPREHRRNVKRRGAKIEVLHHLSWAAHVR